MVTKKAANFTHRQWSRKIYQCLKNNNFLFIKRLEWKIRETFRGRDPHNLRAFSLRGSLRMNHWASWKNKLTQNAYTHFGDRCTCTRTFHRLRQQSELQFQVRRKHGAWFVVGQVVVEDWWCTPVPMLEWIAHSTYDVTTIYYKPDRNQACFFLVEAHQYKEVWEEACCKLKNNFMQ